MLDECFNKFAKLLLISRIWISAKNFSCIKVALLAASSVSPKSNCFLDFAAPNNETNLSKA